MTRCSRCQHRISDEWERMLHGASSSSGESFAQKHFAARIGGQLVKYMVCRECCVHTRWRELLEDRDESFRLFRNHSRHDLKNNSLEVSYDGTKTDKRKEQSE